MIPKLNCVMLVDDCEADNFLHRLQIEKAGLAHEIREFLYADEALSFLRSPNRPDVDLILLDINMLGMDGFEFADEYNRLYPELIGPARLIMLTGSIHPEDEHRADAHPAIAGFMIKPLVIENLQQLLAMEQDLML